MKGEYAVKKILKIVFLIIGIIALIFMALIGIGLCVDFEYDDHIENGRYTYVPEEENKDPSLGFSTTILLGEINILHH